jgi:hypothetical protein
MKGHTSAGLSAKLSGEQLECLRTPACPQAAPETCLGQFRGILCCAGRRDRRTSVLMKKGKERLLPRAAQKCIRMFADTYRATTGRECRSKRLFSAPC